MRRFGCIFALACALGMVMGCGGNPEGRQAISGTVSVDGTPVDQGSISFQPVEGGTIRSGATISGGKYSIPADQGLPPGKYRVVINAPKPGTGQLPEEGAMPGDELPPPEEWIPPEWNTNSQQTIEVSSGSTEFNFDISTAAKS